MSIIKMCHDKTLLITRNTLIYQNENNGDTIDFFIPLEHDHRELSQALIRFDYILPNGVSGYKMLGKDESTYDHYNLYHLVVDDSLTMLGGRVRFWLTILEDTNNIILKTSESYLEIIPTIDIMLGRTEIPSNNNTNENTEEL